MRLSDGYLGKVRAILTFLYLISLLLSTNYEVFGANDTSIFHQKDSDLLLTLYGNNMEFNWIKLDLLA